MDLETIIRKQGWNDDTVLMLLWNFITERGLKDDVAAYFKTVADEENEDV